MEGPHYLWCDPRRGRNSDILAQQYRSSKDGATLDDFPRTPEANIPPGSVGGSVLDDSWNVANFNDTAADRPDK